MTKSTTRKLTRTALLGSASLTLMLSAAHAEQAIEFKIQSGSLVTALNEYARQSDQEILFSSDIVAGKEGKAVNGVYEPQEALEMILADTGLVYAVDDGDTVLIKDPTREAAAPRSFRMAQLDQEDAVREINAQSENEQEEQDVIIVTGTNIRGATPAGSRVRVLDRQDLDDIGVGSIEEALISSSTQNFGGGQTQAIQGVAGSGTTNISSGGGSSINLRGLGTQATLTLLNGRRMAAAGGDFVDISLFPLSAVERIEILAEGSSAIYGADAVAGVVNIILRTDYDGAETRARLGTVTKGGQQEYQVSQLFGKNWEGGNILLSYDYSKREALFSNDRDFAATSDLTAFGGDNFDRDFSNPGNIVTGGVFGIPANQDGSSLVPGDLIAGAPNMQNQREGLITLPEQERHSIYVYANQALSDSLAIFVEFGYAHRDFFSANRAQEVLLSVPSTHPFFVDPVGGSSSISIRYSLIDDLGPQISNTNVESFSGVLGAEYDLFSDWRTELTGVYNVRNQNGSLTGISNSAALQEALGVTDVFPNFDPTIEGFFNPFGDGSNTNQNVLDFISGFSNTFNESKFWSVTARADGTLFSLPGGDIKLALGGEYRDERLANEALRFTSTVEPAQEDRRTLDRNIWAAYGEISIPLVGDNNALPGIRRFELGVAGRYENYSDFGETTNPKVGALWEPIEGLNIRGTYGTSFRAPLLNDLDESADRTILFIPFPDPMATAPSGLSNTLVLFGNNASLRPEEATTWTVGFDYNPSWLPNLNFDVTYFDIEYRDQIARIDNFAILLPNEDQFASLITRPPEAADFGAPFLADPNILNITGTSDPNDIDLIIDARVSNRAVTELNGLDFEGSYRFVTSAGSVDLGLAGTYLFSFEEAVSSTAESFDILNTIERPIDLRLRGRLGWENGPVRIVSFVNFANAYNDTISTPNRKIDSYTTVDLQLAYNVGDAVQTGIFSDTSVALTVRNLFDEDPPFVNNPLGVGFDPTNSNPQGRFVAFEIRKAW